MLWKQKSSSNSAGYLCSQTSQANKYNVCLENEMGALKADRTINLDQEDPETSNAEIRERRLVYKYLL